MKRIFTTLKEKWPEYLLEIIAITLGIWGAYMIEDWKEERDHRELEATYKESIHKEFADNMTQLQKVTEVNREALQYSEMILRQYTSSQPNIDSISRFISPSFITYSFDPSQSSIQSLLSTSNLRVIQDEELRRLIVSWSERVKDYKEEETQAINYFFRDMLPYMTKNFNFIALNNGNPPADVEMEFINMVMNRITLLRYMISSEDKELENLQETIKRIVELTAPAAP
ncbi:MAG: hypothetical protein AB8B73_12040 [Ekhidna sp.]